LASIVERPMLLNQLKPVLKSLDAKKRPDSPPSEWQDVQLDLNAG
jgi:hypothetical protein